MDSKAALAELMAGNRRFVEGNLRHPHQDAERRREQTAGQAPFAVVLGCADSRIPPEILFDQGIGDLFVIRVAGNVVTPELLASVEYALAHLGTKLVAVLGHSACGAVAAALAGGEPASPALASLMERLEPVLDEVDDAGRQERTEKANVRHVVEQLEAAQPIVAAKVAAGVEVVGLHYDQASGVVSPVE